MELLEEPQVPQGNGATRFPWLATVLLGAGIVLLLLFSWQVFSFYRKIQKGDLDPGAFALSRPASSEVFAAFAANAKGSGAMATSDDPALGNANAVLTIVEFADFGCPYSKAESTVVRALAKKFPNSVRFIYRDFPIEDLHPGAELAAYAGYCAHKQGAFWEFHDEAFAQTTLDENAILGIAEELNLDVDRFVSCVNDESTKLEVEEDMSDGYAAGVRGTPTFFFNGEMVEGEIPYDIFVTIIEAFGAESISYAQ